MVIASGAFNRPSVPALSAGVPAVAQVTPFDYRSPGRLAEGGVLAVGASATGVQIAAELARSGPPVTLAVGDRRLDAFDAWAAAHPAAAEGVGAPERFGPTRVPASPRWQLDLRRGEIGTIVWATGFQPVYRWLEVPVVDEKGSLRHDGGVVDSPGLYALGLPVLRRRRSTFLHGIGDDAREVVDHLSRRA